MRPIGKFESSTYAVIFLAVLAKASYSLWEFSQALLRKHGLPGRLFTSHRDPYDYDWFVREDEILNIIKLGIAHALIIRLLLLFNNGQKYRAHVEFVIGFITLASIVNIKSACILLAMSVTFYYLIKWASSVSSSHQGQHWKLPLSGWSMFSLRWLYYNFLVQRFEWLASSDDIISRMFVRFFTSWNALRTIGFAFEWYNNYHQQPVASSNNKKESSNTICRRLSFNLIDYLAFSFYSPTLFGAIINYKDFHDQVLAIDCMKEKHFDFVKCLNTVLEVSGWFLLYIFIQENFAIHYLSEYPDPIKSEVFGSLSSGVLIVWHGQSLHAKYCVYFGIPQVFAYLSANVELYGLPMTIFRAFTPTRMFSKFDPGLYDFIKRYIYLPAGGLKHRIVSSAACYGFVMLWHGVFSPYIIGWAILNYFNSTVESSLRRLLSNDSRLKSRISSQWWQRLAALGGALSYLITGFSMMYFMIGPEASILLLPKTFASFHAVLGGIFVFYCWIQTIFLYEDFWISDI